MLLVRGPSWTLTPLARIPDIPPASEGGGGIEKSIKEVLESERSNAACQIPPHQGGIMFAPPPGWGEIWA